MGKAIVEVVRMLADYVTGARPNTLSIPDSVADPEAVHAVQKHYAEAGFACDEDTARAVVEESR
jgi:hypothetical protein